MKNEEEKMHARVTEVRAQPGKAKELVEMTRDVVLPAAKDLEGFGGMLGLIDEEGGHALAITLWESEAYMDEVESSGVNAELVAKISHLLAAEPYMSHYRVQIHTLERDRNSA